MLRSLFPLREILRGCSRPLGGLLLSSLLLFGLVLAYHTAFSRSSALEAAGATSFTFTAAGDHGWGPDTDASLASLQSSGASFHIALGDLGYTSDESGWCDYFKSQFNNIVFITGNHDTDESGPGSLVPGYVGACPFTLQTSLAGDYGTNYYFDYPSTNPLARFILVAAAIGSSEVDGDYSQGTTNYNFVSNAIENARSQGIPWVVVGMHKGCIYAGDKGSCDIGQDFFDLLLSKRVDVILQAHAHIYLRSHQLSCAPADTTEQGCIVDSDNSFTKGQGSVVVIDGTFGHGNRSVDPGDPEAGYFAELMDSDYGFVKYTVSQERIDAQFVSSTGTYNDSFSVSGSGSGTNPPTQPGLVAQIADLWLLITGLALGAVAGIVFFGRKSRGRKSTNALSRSEPERQSRHSSRESVPAKRGSSSSTARHALSKRKLAALLLCSTLVFGAVSLLPVTPQSVAALTGAFTFGSAGDIGNESESNARATRDAVHGASLDFFLVLGDLGYVSDEAGWCSWWKDPAGGEPDTTWIAGNHDTSESGPSDYRAFQTYCPFTLGTLTGEYGVEYYFDYPATSPVARFIFHTSGVGGLSTSYNVGSLGYSFVSNAIDQAKAAGLWVIVSSHKGCPYPGDYSGCDWDTDLNDLLYAKKADLVLNAHAHVYGRSHQLACATLGTTASACILDTDVNFVKGLGTVTLNIGTGGHNPRSMSDEPESGYYAQRMDTDSGFGKFTVSSTSLSYSFISSTGSYTDTFTIGSGGPLPLSSSFTYTPVNPFAGQMVTFTGLSTGGQPPYSYSWNFGDSSIGSGSMVSHSYNTDGNFAVTVTVTDSSNAQTSATKSVRVTLVSLIVTTFRFVDPGGMDVTGKLSLQVLEGNSMVSTTNPVNLDPALSYELRIYYKSYEIQRRPFTPQDTVETTVYVYQHQSAPDAYIAFSSPIDVLVIHQESSTRLNFHAEGTNLPYTMIMKVPKAPVVVTKDGSSNPFTFDPGLSVVVITTSSLSVWELTFEAPAQPPPPPDNQPDGSQCFLTCQPIPGSALNTIWLFVLGGVMGLTLSLATLTARANSRLNRVRRMNLARKRWK